MRLPSSTWILLAGVAIAGCAPQVDTAAEEEAVRAVSASWLAFEEQRDAAGVAGLFAADGTLHWEEREPVTGPAAVQSFIAEEHAFDPAGTGSFATERVEMAASGDLAVEHGTWQNGQENGRYTTVYRKVDGQWKVSADMSLAATPNGGAPAWATDNLEQWYEAYNARDARRLAAMYTTDARVGEARGRQAITARFQNTFRSGQRTCSGTFDDFRVVGTVAAGWGRDTCTVTPADGGATTTVRSHWLAVFERQADGSWLIIRDNGEMVGG